MRHATCLAVLILLAQGASAAPGAEQGLLEDTLSQHAEQFDRDVQEKLDRLLDPGLDSRAREQAEEEAAYSDVRADSSAQAEDNDKAFTIAGLLRIR